MTRSVLGDRIERKVLLVNWDPITLFCKLESSWGLKTSNHFTVYLTLPR